MTGDFLVDLVKSPSSAIDLIYGIEGTQQGGYSNTGNRSQDFFIDRNNYFPGTLDKTTIGDVVVYRDPCGSFMEICKQSSTASPVTGIFTFTATNVPTPPNLTFFTTDPLTAPVGYCTGAIPVPAGTVVVAETPTADAGVSAITLDAGASQDVLVSTDLTNGTATLMVAPVAAGAPSSEAVLTFTNEGTGQLKICKIFGPGVKLGTVFEFTVLVTNDGRTRPVTYMIPAGPESEGGYCLVDGTFSVGTSVTVAEVANPPYTVTGITVNVNGSLIASTPIDGGTAVSVVIDPGFTEVTFTNSCTNSPFCSTSTGGGQGGRLVIANYSLVGQQAAGDGQSSLTYRADLLNGGPALGSVTATLLTGPDGSSVGAARGQPTLHFAEAPANSQVTSSNTFTILADPTVPVDFSKLRWAFRSRQGLPTRPRSLR